MDDFDRRHRRHNKLVSTGLATVGIASVLYLVAYLAVLGVLVYVALHFVAKFW